MNSRTGGALLGEVGLGKVSGRGDGVAVFIAFGAAGAGPAAPESLAAVGGFAEAWGWGAAGGAGAGLGVDAPFARLGPKAADESGGGPAGGGGEEDPDDGFGVHAGR